MKKPIYLGERQLKLSISDTTVYFDTSNLIEFVDKNDCVVLKLDPTELSMIYGSYMQMRREENTV